MWSDNTPIRPGQLKYYTLYWGFSSGTYTNSAVVTGTSYTLATGSTSTVFVAVTAAAQDSLGKPVKMGTGTGHKVRLR